MRRLGARALLLAPLALGALAACKSESKAAPAPVASVSAHDAAAASGPPKPHDYAGTYTATAGALYVPDGGEYSGFKFRGADAGALGEGEGTLTFTVEPDGGALSGKLDGPLGPATVTGQVQNGALTFHVAPGAGEMAFRGTGTGTLDDAGVATGQIHASSWHADILRTATFTAKAK